MSHATPLTFTIEALNRASETQAAAMMDRIVERSAWLAHRAAAARPFRDSAHLAAWLASEVRGVSPERSVEFLCAHPELAPPAPETMTNASQSEQGRLGLMDPAPEVAARLADLNRQYMRRFGYPFVIALHAQPDLAAVFAQFEDRLSGEPEAERSRALEQVISVMTARLNRLIAGAPAETGDVT